ncbi:uncharacterized protein LOC135687153 [Rhopilema esculentum]|uniref:uncharacterized protein LOC135687153 n=1 Tax=Rhopilema esculentum TaxID=499914 RepID=UPI0031DC93C3
MSGHRYSPSTQKHEHSASFVHKNGMRSPKISPLSQSLLDDGEDRVQLHRLIIANDIVVCMPQVNKVLRTVYQVLSQANYYLSKHGISSRRFSGAQLIKIKMLGILNHDAKVCSYIKQQEAERIFDSFDLSGSCHKSGKITWMDPILLDENGPEAINGSKDSDSDRRKSSASPVDIQVFELNKDYVVCAPDIQKVIQTHFNQGATTGYYFSKLGIVPFKFIHSAHLDKVKELGIIKKSAVHCTYVAKDDAKRVFEAYGMTPEDMKSKINWLSAISLDDLPGWSSHRSIKREHMQSPSQNSSSPHGSEQYDDDVKDNAYGSKIEKKLPAKVSVFLVEGKEVVCMPDIHRIVQSVHGSSIQVNYYLNKLHVKKKRFCFAHLKELKARGILQGNATYCTYIPKVEAEKIFQIYSLMGDQRINELEWSETLSLDPYGSRGDYGNSRSGFSEGNDEHEPAGLSVATFIVDGEEVICTPDVHKIVDYLEEQSASLDYHFRKLGIVKHRYTYSQLHQLRRLQIIKRPTVCTYIRKIDVEQLLLMYATERNRPKMQRIHWQDAMPLLASEQGPQPTNESPSASPANNTHNTEENNSNHHASTPDYEMSDLYKMYVSDKCHSEPDGYNDGHVSMATGRNHRSNHAMTSIADMQQTNPHIDCPIVIPNADFDPKNCSTPLNFGPLTSSHGVIRSDNREGTSSPLKRRMYENDDSPASKKQKESEIIERLLKDLHRKENEFRYLHDAYQREISIEREKRVEVESELHKLRDDLGMERQIRERLEDELKHIKEAAVEDPATN